VPHVARLAVRMHDRLARLFCERLEHTQKVLCRRASRPLQVSPVDVTRAPTTASTETAGFTKQQQSRGPLSGRSRLPLSDSLGHVRAAEVEHPAVTRIEEVREPCARMQSAYRIGRDVALAVELAGCEPPHAATSTAQPSAAAAIRAATRVSACLVLGTRSGPCRPCIVRCL
jgi:hypothetical protein